jgi:hypothetical protein
MELVIRFGFGANISWVKRTEDRRCWRLPDRHDGMRTPVETRGEDPTTVADFEVSEGQTIPFVLSYGPSHLPRPDPMIRRRRCRMPRISGPNGAAIAPTRATTRSGDAIVDHAESADLRRPAASSRRRRPLPESSGQQTDYRFAGCDAPSRCWR